MKEIEELLSEEMSILNKAIFELLYAAGLRVSELTDIRFIADTSSIEIYLNGGAAVLSSRMYPDETDVGIRFEGISGILYDLDEIEVTFDE